MTLHTLNKSNFDLDILIGIVLTYRKYHFELTSSKLTPMLPDELTAPEYIFTVLTIYSETVLI